MKLCSQQKLVLLKSISCSLADCYCCYYWYSMNETSYKVASNLSFPRNQKQLLTFGSYFHFQSSFTISFKVTADSNANVIDDYIFFILNLHYLHCLFGKYPLIQFNQSLLELLFHSYCEQDLKHS
jgi:hypothetical protein